MVFEEQTIATSFVQKIESEAANFKRSNSLPLDDRPLRIGYFGLLRDEWSWQVLESLAKTHSDKIEIVLAAFRYIHSKTYLPSLKNTKTSSTSASTNHLKTCLPFTIVLIWYGVAIPRSERLIGISAGQDPIDFTRAVYFVNLFLLDLAAKMPST